MKKIISAVLAMVLCLGVFAGCSNNKVAPWDVSDFSFYDSSGKGSEILPTSTSIVMSIINNKSSSVNQTKRTVKIGDDAITALKKYDLNGFGYSISVDYGKIEITDSIKKHAAQKNEEFHKEYSTFSEAMQHSEKIIDSYLSLKGYATFYLNNGSLIQSVADENGKHNFDMDKYSSYWVTFVVKDQKISDIEFTLTEVSG